MAPVASVRPPVFGSYYGGTLGGLLFRWIDILKVRLLRRELARLPTGARVLDLGCGSGAIAAALRTGFPGLRLLAGEGEPALAGMAASRGVPVVRLDFNGRLPFADRSLECVVMVDTIEHVDSRRALLDEVTRVLTRDGLFLALTPPYDTLPWLLAEKVHRLVTGRMAGHISPFTQESLAWLLSRHFQEWRMGYLNAGLTLFGIGRGVRGSGQPLP